MNHGTDNQKVLGNCPSCQRLMQIPVVTDVASLAKCPHCNNEIRVRDLLASAVPEAEIIAKDDDKDKNRVSDYIADRQRVYDDDKAKPREKYEVPNQLYNGASRRNRKRKVRSKGSSSSNSSSRNPSSRKSSSRRRPSNNGNSENGQAAASSSAAKVPSNDGGANVDPSLRSGSSPAAKSVSGTNGSATASNSTPATESRPASVSSVAPKAKQERRAPASTPRSRRSSSRRSSDDMDDDVEVGAAEVFKFLIGGLIAAPLAYLALLWVLGVDPFGMASTFESISPAIIPDALRSEGYGDEPRPGFAPPTGDSSSSLFETTNGESGFDDEFEDEGLPLPSLDPDLVR